MRSVALDRLRLWWKTGRRYRPSLVDTLLPMPDIWTPRLHLRAFIPGDAAGIHGYGSDPATAKYMVWPQHKGLADSEATLEYFLGNYMRGDDIPIALVRRSDGRILGCSGFQYPLRRTPWVAWILRSDVWGQGYGHEAMKALLAWGWRTFPRWIHMEAPIHPKNLASIHLAKKLGFKEIPCDMKFQMTNLNGRLQKSTNWLLERPR